MTTHDIAEKLVAHCRQGKWEAAQKELYAADAVSIEPEANAAFAKETKGLNAIIEKGRKFDGMIEKVHSIEASDPLVNGNSIALVLKLDVTMKGQGRMAMSEICVYHVKDGKIVYEEFHL
jgi:hypothetical protein